ncbi:MAG: group 1 truncated hemoglobin [Bdellovibrionota bacterium]
MPEDLKKFLWPELGTSGRLRSLLDDFYERASKDILIGFFFLGKDLSAIAQKQTEFLLRAMGQTDRYSGRSPAHAHLGLAPILGGHFDRRTVLLRNTMADHGLSPAAQDAWVQFEALFRESIVTS